MQGTRSQVLGLGGIIAIRYFYHGREAPKIPLGRLMLLKGQHVLVFITVPCHTR